MLAWLLAGCAAGAPNRVAGSAADGSVYVVARGWHTELAVPDTMLDAGLAPLGADLPGMRYLVFGFGDRRYVLARWHGVGQMLRALLPGRGAILVTALRAPPEAAFGPADVVRLALPPGGAAALDRFLRDSLTPDGAPPDAAIAPPIAPGPYPGSRFYAARAAYSGLFTCNTWTAEALRAAGVPVAAAGVLFAGQVMGQARWLAATSPPPPVLAAARSR